MPTQDNWRNCWKCQALFYNGHPETRGVCPQGGQHEGFGQDPKVFNFVLTHGLAPTATSQAEWRNCWKCQALFYDGHQTKGVCPAGGGHEGHGDDARTFNFVLTHDVAPTGSSQAEWRNCWDCQVLFYNGHQASKGVCPVGGGHEGHPQESFNFVLPFLVGS
jgi:hypothetical protein